MIRNTITYTTLTSFGGEVVNGDGFDASSDLAVIAAMIATEDTRDNHVLQVTRIEFGEDGKPACADVTSDAAEMVAALYDDPNVATSHEHFVSPLVRDWTDWSPIPSDPYWRPDHAEHGLSVAQVL